jgi:hypothetical protein
MTEATVSFAGNLTDDPQVRYTDSGIARATVRVAVSGRREQEASLFTVIVWRDQAEHARSPSRRQPSRRRGPAPAADLDRWGRQHPSASRGRGRRARAGNCAGQRRPRPGRGEARHSSHVEHQRAPPALLPPPGLHLRPHRRTAPQPIRGPVPAASPASVYAATSRVRGCSQPLTDSRNRIRRPRVTSHPSPMRASRPAGGRLTLATRHATARPWVAAEPSQLPATVTGPGSCQAG